MPISSLSLRRSNLLMALSLWGAFLMAGVCPAGGFDADVDLWPLLYIASDEETDERLVEMLGPLFLYRDSPRSRRIALRPIYHREEDKTVGRVERESPWPLAFGTRTDTRQNSWVFPLYHREAQLDPDSQPERRRFNLLPFVIYREAWEDKPRDLLVWPFGGTLHDWYGRDRIFIFAWPLYVHQHSEEADSWDVPWPFVTYVRWQDEGRGFRLWPLYGRNHRPDRLDKRFVLWPFYTRVWARDEMGREVDRWMVWPFYGSMRAPGSRARVWLWPFFAHTVDGPAREERWDFPWPFLGRTKGLEDAPLSGGRVWPLAVWENRGQRRRRQFLWPFVWWDSLQPEGQGDDWSYSLRVMPFLFHAREETSRRPRPKPERERLFFGPDAERVPDPDPDPAPGPASPLMLLRPPLGAEAEEDPDGAPPQEETAEMERTGITLLWPLYRWEQSAGGVVEQEVLSLWPGRTGGGWMRNWAPLFRVWHRVQADEDHVSTRFLWRLMRIERTPEERFFELKPLVSIRRRFHETEKDDTVEKTSWRLLGGLLGRERSEESDALRLLWFGRIPLNRGDEEADP